MAGRGSSQREVNELLRECRKQGMTTEEHKDGQGHWIVSRPGYGSQVRVSFSPGSSRSLNNTIAILKRELGLTWKGRTSSAPPRYVVRSQEEEIEDVPPEPVRRSDQERGQRRSHHARSRRR